VFEDITEVKVFEKFKSPKKVDKEIIGEVSTVISATTQISN
jgi:hypothetical protein